MPFNRNLTTKIHGYILLYFLKSIMGLVFMLSMILYAGQEATVRTGHGTTDWFQIGKGVHQGCRLSPWLFIFFFPFIFIIWRLITLQYCSGFCHSLTRISHGFTCIPHPDPPPPPSPPDPSGSSQCFYSNILGDTVTSSVPNSLF